MKAVGGTPSPDRSLQMNRIESKVGQIATDLTQGFANFGVTPDGKDSGKSNVNSDLVNRRILTILSQIRTENGSLKETLLKRPTGNVTNNSESEKKIISDLKEIKEQTKSVLGEV